MTTLEFIQKAGQTLTGANGKLTSTNRKALKEILTQNTLRPFYYSGRGRFTTCAGVDIFAPVLKALGIDFEEGNDAPRGGHSGYFIRITEKGRAQLASVKIEDLDAIQNGEVIEACKAKARERAAKRNALIAEEAAQYGLNAGAFKKACAQYSALRAKEYSAYLEAKIAAFKASGKHCKFPVGSINFSVALSRFEYAAFEFMSLSDYLKNIK